MEIKEIKKIKNRAAKLCEQLDKLSAENKEHTLKYKRLESELENISLLLNN